MDVAITSSFSEKDNKLEISSNSSSPVKFEDIVDINNYPNKNYSIRTDSYINNYEQNQINLKFCYKKIGNTFCFLSDKMGNPLIMIGPDWFLYIGFCGGVTVGYTCFLIFCWKKLNIFLQIIGIASYSFYFISYSGTFLLNPGYPERNEDSLNRRPKEKYKFCILCNIWVRIDRDISHCDECDICVEGYDHHCPWTGKCIGRKTQKYFYSFIASFILILLYFFSSIIYMEVTND